VSALLPYMSPSQPRSSAIDEFRLMLLLLQELDGRRRGHREGDKFDRLSICLQGYQTALWRGSRRHFSSYGRRERPLAERSG
jgi:hypothetical protein